MWKIFTFIFALLTAILAVGLVACYWDKGWLSIQSAANLASIFESLAVGFTIFFIAAQLRQQTRLTRASNSQAFVNVSSGFDLMINGNKELVKLWNFGGENYKS